jgi:hypothetical protein
MEFSMNKLALATTLLMASASFSVSADYQVEVTGDLSRVDRDFYDETVMSIGGTYFFAPVVTDGIVLGEAAFLNKSSYAGAGFALAEYAGFDADALGVNGRYVIPGKDFIIEGGLAFGDSDLIEVAAGVYLNDTTEVLVGIADTDLFATDFYVKGKSIFSTNDGKEVGTSGRIGVVDGDFYLEGSGRLFLNRMMSVGAEMGIGFYEDTVIGLVATGEYFVNEQVGFDAKLGFADLSETDLLIAVGVKGRF